MLDRRRAVGDWAKLHALYVKYGRCDDGVIAEGFSDIVDKLVCRHWDHLDELFTLNDDAFFDFVVSHLDESGDWVGPERDGLDCPVGHKDHCRRLKEACRRPAQ